MRVLVTVWAWPTHYFPLVPLCWALRAAGHDVRVASQPALTEVITGSGVTAVVCGHDLDHREVRPRIPDSTREDVPEVPKSGTTTAGMQPVDRGRVRWLLSGFTAHSEAMADDLLSFARDWRPDLVVFDPTTYVGPMVAAAIGVPAVRALHGMDTGYQANDIACETAAPLAARLGVPDTNLLGAATVAPCPPSLQVDANIPRLPMQYLPYNGPAVLPGWLTDPPSTPRICATWGKSTTKVAPQRPFLPPMVINALGGKNIELVLCLSESDAARMGPLPGNVRLTTDLPLHLLLGSCGAIVHHGGQGTTMTAVHHGVPQLILPQLHDQRYGAQRLRQAGAAITEPVSENLTEDWIASAIDALLTEPRYKTAATALGAEMASLPTPAELVPALEDIAQGAVVSG
jgi:UDP:flavonoid glycosyltransferase YjiC (YdhE family)